MTADTDYPRKRTPIRAEYSERRGKIPLAVFKVAQPKDNSVIGEGHLQTGQTVILRDVLNNCAVEPNDGMEKASTGLYSPKVRKTMKTFYVTWKTIASTNTRTVRHSAKKSAINEFLESK